MGIVRNVRNLYRKYSGQYDFLENDLIDYYNLGNFYENKIIVDDGHVFLTICFCQHRS